MAVAAALPKRSRTFGSAPEEGTEPTEVAPLGFTLAGEDFEVFPEAPGIVLLEFIENQTSGTSGGTAKALLGLLRSVMVPEEWDRLNKVLHDPKNRIDIKTISEVVGYITEQYTSRPTSAS